MGSPRFDSSHCHRGLYRQGNSGTGSFSLAYIFRLEEHWQHVQTPGFLFVHCEWLSAAYLSRICQIFKAPWAALPNYHLVNWCPNLETRYMTSSLKLSWNCFSTQNNWLYALQVAGYLDSIADFIAGLTPGPWHNLC
jgi:hypothetical protein